MFAVRLSKEVRKHSQWCVVPLASVSQVDKVRVLEGALVPR